MRRSPYHQSLLGDLVLQLLHRLGGIGDDVVVGVGPAPDQLGERLLVRLVVIIGRGPAADDGGLRIIGRGVGELYGARHLVADGDVERHPQRHGRDGAGDEGGDRGRHGLVDELDLLGVDLVGAQRLVEEHMRGGAGRGRDPLALEIVERLDALVGAHPELRGRHLDVVDQKYLALSAGREVRQHRTGRQHVEAAADQRLKDFEAGVELAQFQIEALLVESCRGPCRSRSGRRRRRCADSRREPWSWPARLPARRR